MSDTIQIVNFLLTRRCNLACSYCRIARDYPESRPVEYPDIGHYFRNEISTQKVLDFLAKLKKHNKDIFVIFYGGEPLLRNDLSKIINFSNKENINYTVITNNKTQEKLDKLLNEVDYLTGLTASIDPQSVSFEGKQTDAILEKSIKGLKELSRLEGVVKDRVAEITCTDKDIIYLPDLIEILTEKNISSSITFIDISKNPYYDFSNITNEDLLVKPTRRVQDILLSIYENDKLDVHMRDSIPYMFHELLPSNMTCNFEQDVHNITVDADGTLRMCLRIRGVETPSRINIDNLLDENGKLNLEIKDTFKKDKDFYCQRCNWTCAVMSQMAETQRGELLHTDKRR